VQSQEILEKFPNGITSRVEMEQPTSFEGMRTHSHCSEPLLDQMGFDFKNDVSREECDCLHDSSFLLQMSRGSPGTEARTSDLHTRSSFPPTSCSDDMPYSLICNGSPQPISIGRHPVQCFVATNGGLAGHALEKYSLGTRLESISGHKRIKLPTRRYIFLTNFNAFP